MRDLLLLGLLFFFGGFAVSSAVLKSRAGVTTLLGVSLTVLEGISGIALMGSVFLAPGSLATASAVWIVTAVLVAFSSTVHLMKVRDRNRARQASEEKRLYTALKYPMGDNPGVTEDESSEPDLSTNLGDGSGHRLRVESTGCGGWGPGGGLLDVGGPQGTDADRHLGLPQSLPDPLTDSDRSKVAEASVSGVPEPRLVAQLS
jgi:hypothetical protein